ncbi:sigma-54 dependent transcriptional regulator [Fluviibacterium sp. DFM31]|uniref:Sigma-54 dependent transcriptional regulator n=1 Tax=Meridianimarinicoccus marinus TaxID=3231483 RepID=A0ABV3L421_9RHOB
MSRRVLLVEDDAPVREALAQTLELGGYNAISAGSFVVAKDHISRGFDGVILSDIRMPGRDGFHLLDYAQKQDKDLPVILLTGEGDIPMAVRAMSEGAFDFLEKPCAPKTLIAVLERALRLRALVLENRALKARATEGDAATRMIFGISKQAEALRNAVRNVAAKPVDVLVTGDPGTGTPKVAEVTHLLSPRARHPFEKRASAGLGPDMLLAALAEAGQGSLFLDEIAALPPESQYVLREKLEETGRARVLAGTYRDLASVAAEGRFDPDLGLKLGAVQVRIPALRDRPEDIPVLFRHYVANACEQAALEEPQVTPDHIARLMAQDWPGNARALMNAAMRFALGLTDQDEAEGEGLAERMARVERSFLVDALTRARGNASEAAKDLRLPRKTFYDKLSRHGLKPEDFR